MLIVFGALKIELENIIRSISVRKKTRSEGSTLYWGDLDSTDTLIVITGMGKKNAASAVDIIFRQREVVEAEEVKVFITGFCGAADGNLTVGDLVAYKKVTDLTIRAEGIGNGLQGSSKPDIFLKDSRTARDSERIRPVVCGCTDHVVATPEEKETLFKEYSIGVVDMESYWLIERLISNGVSIDEISCIRAVSDDAFSRLPLYFSENTPAKIFSSLIRSLFSSILSREEFRTNLDAMANIRKAGHRLDKDVLDLI